MRAKRDEARRLVAEGVDPSAERKASKLARQETFRAIAEEWLALQAKTLAPVTFNKARWMLTEFVYPRLGSRPINEISPPDLLAALRAIESRGRRETAHQTKQRVGQIFRYAIATGRAERDISADLRGALAPVVTRNHAAITEPKAIGQLLRAIDGYGGQPVTYAALKLAPLVFVRPGELRQAEWSEIDLEAAEWRIPAQRMKMRELHIVPLSKQAVEILAALRPLTGRSRYVFPSLRTGERPISENTINAALRRLGYGNDEMTAHGFRAMASTCLNEQGWHPDVIELQLAHAERNKVRAAYNRATRLPERRRMMQAWADHLDSLRAGAAILSSNEKRVSRVEQWSIAQSLDRATVRNYSKNMALGTGIEWTDATWNPVSGCTKITRGCDNCYAERLAERFRGVRNHPFEHGFDLTLREHKLREPLSWRAPRRVFVNSMSDLFHKEIPTPFIDQVFETMEAAHWHVFQVLTKRSSLMRGYVNRRYSSGEAPAHIWFGVSVEDQRALTRMVHLKQMRAAVRFVSFEPLWRICQISI